MNPVHYRIAPYDLNAHLLEVRCTVDAPDPAGQRFRLPAWIPGSYLIREFARQFVDVRADSAGAPLPIIKESKDVWRTAPTQSTVSVVAQVYAYDLSVRTAYVDRTRVYFNGPAVFLSPEGHEHAPCVVDIVAPDGDIAGRWHVATTLDRDGASPHGFGRYRAASYDELIDHPVEISDFSLAAFTAGGVPHEIAVTGRQQADLHRLARDFARLCQWHVDLFGGAPRSRAPFDRYLFQITAVGDGYGGLEHRSSTSLLCRRDELPLRGREQIGDNYVNLLGLASHEYFHSWNVKRIKPAAFVPYDLAREGYTRQLWAFEGVTSYYDDLALVRSGLIDDNRYLELLGRTISNVLRTPGRHRQSVADSSFDAWIKFYRQDENSPNAVVSYYAKGSLVALALDLTLRRDGSSLDRVMRTLWERYGVTGEGVPEEGIERVVSELASSDMQDFFARYVHGIEDPPLEKLLAAFGVDWHLRPASNARDRGGKPASDPPPACWLGAKVRDDMSLQHVFAGSPAERAGVAANDVLIAIDGVRASASALDALRNDRTPGQRVTVHAFRRDELIAVELELAPPPLDTCWLTLRDGVSSEAAQLRAAWLHG
jgi:predicted metalloprotease with PDZ domain